jgi:hypothetical protein
MGCPNKTQPDSSEADFLRFRKEMNKRGYSLTKLDRGSQFKPQRLGARRYEVWLEGDGFYSRVGAGHDFVTALREAYKGVATTLSDLNLFKPGRMAA